MLNIGVRRENKGKFSVFYQTLIFLKIGFRQFVQSNLMFTIIVPIKTKNYRFTQFYNTFTFINKYK